MLTGQCQHMSDCWRLFRNLFQLQIWLPLVVCADFDVVHCGVSSLGYDRSETGKSSASMMAHCEMHPESFDELLTSRCADSCEGRVMAKTSHRMQSSEVVDVQCAGIHAQHYARQDFFSNVGPWGKDRWSSRGRKGWGETSEVLG
jgi:hypothetical protein